MNKINMFGARTGGLPIRAALFAGAATVTSTCLFATVGHAQQYGYPGQGQGQTQTQQCYYNCYYQGGQIGTSVGGAGIRATRTFTDTLNDRNEAGVTSGNGTAESEGAPAGVTAYAPVFVAKSPINVRTTTPQSPYRVYATAFGGGFNTNNSGVAGETGNFYGGLAGVDYFVNNNFVIGAAAGGSESNVTIGAVPASGRVTGFNGSLYAIVSQGSFYGQSLTTLSSFSNSTTRIAGAAVEHASFGSFEVRERMEVGRVYNLGNVYGFKNVKLTPFVALEIAQLHLNGHSEFNINGAGPGADLATQGLDQADVPGFVGARFETSYDVGNGMVLRPVVRLAYVHQFASSVNALTTTVAGATVVQNGTLLARNSAQTKVGAELDLGHGTVVFANFDGQFSGTDQLYGGRAGVRYRW